MVNNHTHLLAGKQAGDAHLVAGEECGVIFDGQPMIRHVEHPEKAGIVEQAHIHATAVGRIVVHNLQTAVLQSRVGNKVVEHRAVLDFRHTDYCRTLRCQVASHLADGIRHIVDFLPILVAIPLASAVRTEFEVVFTIIVDGIEQILQVIECYSESLILLLLGKSGKHRQSNKRHYYK